MPKTPLAVRVPDPDLDWLKTEAERQGLSVAELLRRIVYEYRKAQEDRR